MPALIRTALTVARLRLKERRLEAKLANLREDREELKYRLRIETGLDPVARGYWMQQADKWKADTEAAIEDALRVVREGRR